MSFMAEPKPMASLSSGLLARKGAARPAMRRQGMDGLGTLGTAGLTPGVHGLQDDLGWNDMGYDVDPAHEERAPHYGNLLAGAIPDAVPGEPVPEMAPVVPDVVRQQAEIAERLAEPVAAPEPVTAPELDLQPEIAPVPEPVAAIAVAEPVAAPVPAVRQRKRKQAVMQEVVAAAVQSSARRAAFTLRLDAERHLKLRLASAVSGQSAQQLVTAALDELLTKMTEIEDLAGRVTRSATL
jgi:predicted HicB family RNase H-like nuclease